MNMLWKTNKISYYLWFTGSVVTSIACSFTVFRVLQSQSKFPRPLTGQMFLFKKSHFIIYFGTYVWYVHMHAHMYICTFVCGYACPMAQEWKSDGHLQESVLSFYLVDPWG